MTVANEYGAGTPRAVMDSSGHANTRTLAARAAMCPAPPMRTTSIY